MKLNPMKVLNEKGSILVQAIVATVVIGVAAVTILQRSLDINRQLRTPRIKAAQANVELALRQLLLQPTFYSGCDSDVAATAGPGGCTMDAAALADLFEPVPGCAGLPPATCGVRVRNPVFDKVARTFTGVIDYTGTEVPIADATVTIVVPVEVLQSLNITCDFATPLFTGFNADGTKRCRALPAPCGPGSFVSGFDATNLAVQCTALQSSAVTCPPAQYISSFAWTAGGTITFACSPRPPPGTLWPPPL